MLYIIQWGKERSIVSHVEPMKKGMDVTILIMDNQQLMNLDEMGLVV